MEVVPRDFVRTIVELYGAAGIEWLLSDEKDAEDVIYFGESNVLVAETEPPSQMHLAILAPRGSAHGHFA
ncbi:MAG: hypothetical protein ACE5LU_03060 [Anaerolineae bacterium]